LKEEDYTIRLEELQDEFLDLINEKEMDLGKANAVMIEFLEIGTEIAIQMEYRVKNKIILSQSLQESVNRIAHIKNISEILRKRLGK
jgi:hypothetical protein